MLACPASTSDLSSVSTIGLPGAMFDVEPVFNALGPLYRIGLQAQARGGKQSECCCRC